MRWINRLSLAAISGVAGGILLSTGGAIAGAAGILYLTRDRSNKSRRYSQEEIRAMQAKREEQYKRNWMGFKSSLSNPNSPQSRHLRHVRSLQGGHR